MRRVLILVLLLALVGLGVAAVLILGGGDDSGTNGDGDATVQVDNGEEQSTATPTPNVVPVVIAVQDIPRGTRITEGDVAVQFWPDIDAPGQEAALAARLLSVDEAVGRLARTDIPIYSPVLQTQLVEDPSQLADVGSDAATLLEPNRLAIAVPLDPTGLGQVAYGLQPGDSVDIIMTFAFIDVDEFFQTRIPNTISILAVDTEGNLTFTSPQSGIPEGNVFELDLLGLTEEGQRVTNVTLPGAIGPSEKIQRPRIVTQRTITGAQVVWVGWFPADGRIYGRPTPTPFEEIEPPTPVGTPPAQQQPEVQTSPEATSTPYTPVIMTLAVTPQDAVILTWAIESGVPITYALRSAAIEDSVVIEETQAVTLNFIRNRYQIPDPNTLRLTYTLEPRPIIRRFDLNSLRRFVELQADEISNQSADPLREDLLREDLFIGAGGGGGG